MKKYLLLFMLIPFLTGTTYYMRADGTAANKEAASGPCGTQANCMSIATHDADTYSAGDTIYLCDDGGVFRGNDIDVPSSGSNGSPITYAAASGDSPVINGSDIITGNWSGPDGNGEYTDDSIDTETQLVYDDGVVLTEGTAGSLAADEWDWTSADGGTLFLGANPSGSVIEATQRDGIDVFGVNYIDIEDLTIEKCQDVCINVYLATNINITDSTIRDAVIHPIQYNNASTGTISGCAISNPGLGMVDGAGVEIIDDSTVTITQSSIFCDESYSNGNQDGVMLEKGSGDVVTATITENKVYDMDNSGIVSYNNSTGTMTVNHNTIYDNTWHGIQLNSTGDTSNVVVFSNVLYGNGAVSAGRGFISMTNSDGGYLYNNTFYDNNTGVYLEDDCSLDAMKNNLVYDNRGYGINGEAGAAITAFDYNLFNANDSGNYNDAFSEATNDVTADPLLTNAGSDDFTLLSTSPARNKGTDLGATYDDGLDPDSSWPSSVTTLNQDVYGGGWEMGAYVFDDECTTGFFGVSF